jgi:hypothetical protein
MFVSLRSRRKEDVVYCFFLKDTGDHRVGYGAAVLVPLVAVLGATSPFVSPRAVHEQDAHEDEVRVGQEVVEAAGQAESETLLGRK